eukprot:GHVU01113406.1.p1 GENE.GHVU01113406.1~~GHVU01113406.1.p1  ORF type:complete len:168 (-),score=2.78 GHVU01113406.1:311-814(-)
MTSCFCMWCVNEGAWCVHANVRFAVLRLSEGRTASVLLRRHDKRTTSSRLESVSGDAASVLSELGLSVYSSLVPVVRVVVPLFVPLIPPLFLSASRRPFLPSSVPPILMIPIPSSFPASRRHFLAASLASSPPTLLLSWMAPFPRASSPPILNGSVVGETSRCRLTG